MKEIDCRGLPCPAPVLATKKGIEEASGASFRVRLDKGAARENVLRFCASKGLAVSEEIGDESTLLLISGGRLNTLIGKHDDMQSAPVILITSDRLGDGPDELGRLLMKNFLIALLELQKQPEKILFMNSGVLLTTEGSEVSEPLCKLENAGVEILSCGVCLEYFRVKDKLVVGMTTNMYTIAETLLLSGNTVRI